MVCAVVAHAQTGRADDAAAPALRVIPTAPTYIADSLMAWNVFLSVANSGKDTVNLDSLACEVVSRDSGETGTPRLTRFSAPGRGFRGRQVDPGSTLKIDYPYHISALAERVDLRLFVYYHSRSEISGFATAQAVGLPGTLSTEHPSRFLTSGGERVEYVLFPADTAHAPALLLIHGHGSHARLMLRVARSLAASGYVTMLVSQPGYGLSGGRPDFMGPRTIQALSDALDVLRAAPGVDPKRIGIWGVSRGATCAMELCERRADIRAVVAQSGLYDVPSAMAGNAWQPIREMIAGEIGTDSVEWIARSPLRFTNHVHSAVLLLHGEKDPNAPAVDAHRMELALKSYGLHVESYFFPEMGHRLPTLEVQRLGLEFLERSLK